MKVLQNWSLEEGQVAAELDDGEDAANDEAEAHDWLPERNVLVLARDLEQQLDQTQQTSLLNCLVYL